MDKCLGCLGIAFGGRKSRNRLKYRVNYDKSTGAPPGIEFENLVLSDEDHKMNYGTTCHFVSQEEKEFLAKREYDKILEEQRKIDEQIDKKTFEEEERLKIEEERFREAQLEAARAVSAALKVQQYRFKGNNTTTSPDHNLYSIGDSDESDEDFESFLESVKVRSNAFRSDKAKYCDSVEPGNNNNAVISTQPKKLDHSGAFSPDFSKRSRELDGIADGMSSDESFSCDQQLAAENFDNPEMEWDKFVNGLESEEKQQTVEERDDCEEETPEVS